MTGLQESPAAWQIGQLQRERAPIEPTPRQRQLRALLAAFRRGERLTVVEALGRHRIYALSQRVGELKRLNWPIRSTPVKTEGGALVMEYRLATGQVAEQDSGHQ